MTTRVSEGWDWEPGARARLLADLCFRSQSLWP